MIYNFVNTTPNEDKPIDQVKHPIDWWAYGGYDEVMRNTGWNRSRARREVRKVIKQYGWHPIGHNGYTELRKRIMGGNTLDWDLK